MLIDGLRADVAQELPGWRRLAARAVRLRVDVGTPSFSRPVYAVLGTGAPQAHTGVRTNRFEGEVPIDSLFARLVDQGRRAAVVAEDIDWWARLYAPHLGTGAVLRGERVLPTALASFEDTDLLLVHLLAVDHTSHGTGPRSTQAMEAARWADDVASRLVAHARSLGWTVLVGADHGHVLAGGHGGDEPEVRLAPALLAGPGVAARSGGAPLEIRAVDLAPTLAALLGCAAPAQAEGRIVTEALSGASARWAPEVDRLDVAQLRLWRAWVDALSSKRATVWSLDPALQASALQTTARRSSRDLRLLVASLLIGTVFVLLLWRGRRRALVQLLVATSYPVLAAGLYRGVVGRFSFSDVSLRAPFIRSLGAVLAVALVPAAVQLAWLAWRGRGRVGGDRELAGWAAMGLLPAALPALVNAAWLGWPSGSHLAEPAALFLPLVTGPALAAYLAALGLLMVILARGRR